MCFLDLQPALTSMASGEVKGHVYINQLLVLSLEIQEAMEEPENGAKFTQVYVLLE